MTTHRITGAGGVDLVVEEVGSGQAVLLIHGLSQSRYCWQNQLESDLRDDFRLVAPDMRGHGESDKPRDAYADSAVWGEDMHAIIDTLDMRDTVVVAWSYGGLIALDYIASFGSTRVTGLNLVGGVASIGTEAATERLGPQYLELISGFVSTNVEESTRTMAQFVDLCVEDTLPPAERYFQLGYNVTVPPHVRDSLRNRRVTHESVLQELDIPVLLTHGKADAVVKPRASEEYAEQLDDARVSWYPDTGHSPFWERPERFNRELRSFIENL